MVRTTVAVLLCFISFCVNPAFAQTCTEAKPLTVGVVSPCTGVLFPTDWATKAVTCLNVTVPGLESKLTLLEGSLASCEKRADGLSTLCDTKMTELTTLVEETARLDVSTQWYESPVFWGVVGVIAGGALVIGAYELAGK